MSCKSAISRSSIKAVVVLVEVGVLVGVCVGAGIVAAKALESSQLIAENIQGAKSSWPPSGL